MPYGGPRSNCTVKPNRGKLGLFELEGKIARTLLQGDDSMAKYVSRAKMLFTEATDAGSTMTESQFVMHVLHGVHPRYMDQVRGMLKTKGPKNPAACTGIRAK